MPWPTYRFLPAMVRTAGARPVPVTGPLDAERLLAAVTERTRAVVIGNPNDPTGEALSREGMRALADGLPEAAWLLIDEALVDFLPDDRRNDAIALTDEHPRTLVVRTLSKAYGLAGLRCGWAVGPADAAEELTGVAPAGALATPVQAGALEALLDCGPLVASRRERVWRERERILGELRDSPYEVTRGESNALWIALPGTGGEKLAARLDRGAVRVAGGAAWNDLDHVRAQVQSPGASDRLLTALAGAVEG